MTRQFNILICPLEWGLGHAGRMIPVIRKLREYNQNVLIGAGKEIQMFFRKEFPDAEYIDFPGFNPSYSGILPQYAALLLRIPGLVFNILSEHIRLKKLIKDLKIDIVISDNRFGLWSRKIKSVYVTHQILIPFPRNFRFLEWTGTCFHRFFIKRFTFCFIPDLPGENNLSGRLSHGVRLPRNARFVGILSRFADLAPVVKSNASPQSEMTVILSGPEPQKGILRQKLVDILNEISIPSVILEGRPAGSDNRRQTRNILSYNHLSSGEMRDLISNSSHLVTRSGYTSIMELVSLERSALLIPTPGQTEQEYLADYLSEKGWFSAVPQSSISRETLFLLPKTFESGEFMTESRELLEKALAELLK